MVLINTMKDSTLLREKHESFKWNSLNVIGFTSNGNNETIIKTKEKSKKKKIMKSFVRIIYLTNSNLL